MRTVQALQEARDAKGITQDEATHLWFDAKGEVICSDYCTNRARGVRAFTSDADKNDADGWAKASNGQWVKVGEAKCGNHDRSYRPSRAYDIPHDLVTKDPAFNLDQALLRYEDHLAKQRERQERAEQDYFKEKTRLVTMTEDEFVITMKVTDEGRETRWDIEGPLSYDRGHRGVAWVRLSAYKGLWTVETGPYSGHVGRGQGSTALTRIIGRLLTEAADIADERNKEAIDAATSA